MHDLKMIADKALAALKDNGADKAQCAVRFTETHEFNVDGGKFSLFRTLFDNSLSLTAVKDDKKGSVGINRLDDDSIAAAAVNCLAIADSGAADPAWVFAEKSENGFFTAGAPEADLDLLFDRTEELMRQIGEQFPLILMEQMIVTHKKRHSVFKNSLGVEYETLSGNYEISLMFSAHEGEKSSSFFGSGVITDRLDVPFMELGTIREDLENVSKQLDTQPLEGKFTGVAVFPPSSLGTFIGSALGNFASDGTLLDGTSPWKDCLGKVVADPAITISATPLDERIVCGERFTGEGFRSENYDIIKGGVLESFMLSGYVANKTGLPRAKNSSYAIVMKPGETPYADIIAGIERGILVGRFSGGEPGTSGDFSGVAKNSFLIENGKITCALSETMISGNLGDLLKNVVAISSEVVCDGATVLPYAAFGGVTVSGK
ncbi:MAG: TldD/PmbA family protein [Clostridia bacterium]|nr:TldD/PmbA family protein [Clostridia bacterium]